MLSLIHICFSNGLPQQRLICFVLFAVVTEIDDRFGEELHQMRPTARFGMNAFDAVFTPEGWIEAGTFRIALCPKRRMIERFGE